MTTKLLTARMDEGLITRFREKAKEEEQSMSAILKHLIERYLDGNIDTPEGGEEATKKL